MAGVGDRIVEDLTGVVERDDAMLEASGGDLRAFAQVLTERDIDPAQVEVAASAYTRWRARGDDGDAVRGTLGFWLMTMLMVRRTSDASAMDSPEERWPPLQRRLNVLFADAEVRRRFQGVYGRHGSLDLAGASVHRLGTTSFILRCERNDNTRDTIALKCLLYPYFRNRRIAEATRQYATDYGPKEAGAKAHMPRVYAAGGNWVEMDFIEGPTLAEVLDELRAGARERVRLDAVRRYGLPLLTALEEVQVAHLDLVPSNIIMREAEPDGDVPEPTAHVSLVDFGRNYLLSHDVGGGRLSPGQARFVAPELLHGRGSQRSDVEDVFSVGQILVALAGFDAGYGGYLPTKLYEEAPFLAPIVEDLVDLEPDRRLLLAVATAPDATTAVRVALYRDLRRRLRDAIDAQEKLATMSPTLGTTRSANGALGRLVALLGSVAFLGGPVKRPFEFARVAGLFPRHRVTDETANLYRYLFWFVFACSLGWAGLLLVVGPDLAYRLLGISLLPNPHDVLSASWPPIDLSAVWAHYAALSGRAVDWPGLLVRLVVLSFGATAIRYYLDIFAPLTTRPLRVTPGRRPVEIVIRLTQVGAEPLLIVAYVWFLGDWLIASSVATAWIALNNRLSWRLASRLAARGEGEFSTVRGSDLSQALGAFSQWWSLMASYSAMLLVFGIAVKISLGGFAWALAIQVIAFNVIKLYRSDCGKLAPGVRASLHRAFVTGQRLEELDRRRTTAGPGTR
jgi:hypothetical protein